MPTYQYVCTGECGQLLEAVQSFSDAPLDTCPTCGGRLRKKFSAVGVVFKGSGFYKTDSRASSGRSGGAGKDGGSKDGGGKEGSGESTPAKADSGSSSTKESGSGSSSGSGSGDSGGSAKSSTGGSPASSSPSPA